MIILTTITLSDETVKWVVNLLLSGVVSVALYYIVLSFKQGKEVYEYIIQHKERHVKIEDDIKRIEIESNEQYADLKKQISQMELKFESKLDRITTEIKRSNDN